MALVARLLDEWNLPANPINYAVGYDYLDGGNRDLVNEINQHLAIRDDVDAYFMEEVYQRYFLGKGSVRDDLFSDVEKIVVINKKLADKSTGDVNNFIHHLDQSFNQIDVTSQDSVRKVTGSILLAANQLKAQQQSFIEKLQLTHQEANKLKAELAEVKQTLYLDPLTGLFNRTALDKHLSEWRENEPNKQVAAIVLNIDHFSKLTKQFGMLIGNVLLAKMAKKVRSYVGDSGLPVRSGNNEFIVLLPNIDQNIANEIAEKMRQGIEKLRFVSSKSGVRLPRMTVSMAISEFVARESFQNVVKISRTNLKDHASRNQFNHIVFT